MDNKSKVSKKTIASFAFGFLMLLLGALFSHLKLGEGFLGFSNMGLWMVYVGLVSLFILAIRLKAGKRTVDERMLAVAAKANRYTFLFIISGAFIVMMIDGIRPIGLPYSMFMSYMVCAIMLFYAAAYKLLLRYA